MLKILKNTLLVLFLVQATILLAKLVGLVELSWSWFWASTVNLSIVSGGFLLVMAVGGFWGRHKGQNQ